MYQVFLLSVIISYILYAIYKWSIRNFDYFEKRNVKFLKPKPFVGNTGGLFANQCTVVEFAKRLYETYPDEPIVGIFQFSQPQYIIRDPNVIKKIAVKEIDHFENHQFSARVTDKLWGNTLLFMRGDRWRNMRATLSPAFTGNKMRQMFDLVIESANEVVKHFSKKVENGEKINIEMKDFFARYTNDVIASCAFGLEVNSLAEPTNEFYTNARKLTNSFGFKSFTRMLLAIAFPWIIRIFKMDVYDVPIVEAFKHTILSGMEFRKEKKIIRPDMINILMQVREGTLKYQADEEEKVKDGFATVEESDIGKVNANRSWDDDEIVAQCFLFLLAGLDTSSTLMTFTAYELAKNPDIQKKLYDEIAETNEKLQGKSITYEILQKMKYLDQVICESLRMWPPAIQNDRSCSKEYIYDDGKLNFKIEKETPVIFTVYGIHHDPKYFTDPEIFNPDRFSDENKGNIIPGSYFPFGVGPRNCIGSRFALMEIKAVFYNLLLNFSFEPNERTVIPVKLQKTPFTMRPENGMHLALKPRKI